METGIECICNRFSLFNGFITEPEYQEDTQPESEGGCCHHGHCHGYQHMADEWTERPEDGGMTDPLKEDEAERMGGVEDISPGFTEDGTHGMADADDMLRANMGDYHDCAVNGEEEREDEEYNGDDEVLEIKQVRTDDYRDCALNGEEEREELMEDEEFNGDNEVLEIKQVRTDEDCSVWTSVHSEKNSTQLRKRNKK